MPSDRPANRISRCTSPYLRQHAHNPVDWYPWSDEALALAQRNDRPIFLSIGYSACHWCHVMERESFEDEGVAEFLNGKFVPVKVDREERPDLDELYMEAVHAMGMRGGWPLSVWLTPDLKPFYGGTYFPPEPRRGMPSFLMVLERVAEAWEVRRDALIAQAAELTEAISQRSAPRPGMGLPGVEIFDAALAQLRRNHDPRWGGFGPAPKFPAHMAVRLLLRRGNAADLAMVRRTLEAMWGGGMYDHLGGGFARYSVDSQWKVPHFEKMLYDNALLVVAYLEGFQALGVPRFAQVARETLDYLLRDLWAEQGGFHSSEDADSEGEEGRFYTFTPAEVEAILGSGDSPLFCAAYGITSEGSFENGRSVLHRFAAPGELAEGFGLTVEALEARLERGRRRLFEFRNQRIRPAMDDKVLTAWNGLALSALAKGAQVLQEPRYLAAAQACAAFLLGELMNGEGLWRTWRKGQAHTPGFLEDYGAVAQGLVDLYETDFDARWLRGAESLAEQVRIRFLDHEDGGCFSAEAGATDLLFRQKPRWDGALPSGNSLAARVCLHLGRLLDREDFRTAGIGIIEAFATDLVGHPGGHLAMLEALDFIEGMPMEFVFSGDLSSPVGQSLVAEVRRAFLPRAICSRAESEPAIFLHRGRNSGAEPMVHPCAGGQCGLPFSEPKALSAWIEGQKNPS